jgi:hypothetical protein
MNMKIEQSQNNIAIYNDTPSAQGAPHQQVAAPNVMPELSQLACSGDPGAMLAALTMQTAKSESEVSRKTRDAAMSAEEKADAAAVQDLHDKATLQRVQGIVDGALQIAQGACDLGAGLNEASAASQQTEAAAKQADLKENAAAYSQGHIDALKASANSLEAGANTSKVDAAWDHFGSSASGAAKSVADGLFNGAITDKDADSKMHDASSATFKRIADDAHDNENDATALLNKALDFYKEYVDTKNQTAMAAIHRA